MTNIGVLATCPATGEQHDIGLVSDAAIAWSGDRITWVGKRNRLPDSLKTGRRYDASGLLVVPGLIDCHTHLAFGGWRADEFEQRIRGAGYLEIAKTGGGIASTVAKTRRSTSEELTNRARKVLEESLQLGVTTMECKSGYGLNIEDEIKTLRVYRDLSIDSRQPVRLVSTCLGAHVVPPEYKHDRLAYLTLLENELIPLVAAEKLARFFDVFVEDSAFSVEEARRLFGVARRYGLRAKLHADQLHDGGGAGLAADVGAISADHLEYISQEGITAMARKNVVAVSLPIATLYLAEKPMPARACLDAGLGVAVATDFNPGSAPSCHLPLAMMLACTMQRMTPAEVLKGATFVAARAIGMENEVGSILPDKRADFAVVDATDVNFWMYHFRANAVLQTFARGELAWDSVGA